MTSHGQFLDVDALRTDSFVRHVELHETLPSTNDRALELAAEPKLQTPALIVARKQTAGRGRGQHTWWSSEEALAFSLILESGDFGITQKDWPRLSLATSVAVCGALALEVEGHGSRIGIKWPNDVLVDGAKVCGILIESPNPSPSPTKRIIIGIGINVNNSWRDAPSETCGRGTSLSDVTGSQHNRQSILVAVLLLFERTVRQLASNDEALVACWQSYSVLTGKAVVVEDADRRIAGICRGIDVDGALLVESNAGMQRCFTGSVRMTLH